MSLGELRLELEDRLVYANVSGDIDMSNAADLRAELSTTIPNDALGLILDLTDIEYLDSAGIHLIHHLREDLRASGQRLQLVIPPSSMINATLRLAGLDWAENTAETAKAARQALRGGERSA